MRLFKTMNHEARFTKERHSRMSVLAIRYAVGPDVIRGTVDIVDSALVLLVRGHDRAFVGGVPIPIALVGDWIGWNLLEVPVLHEIVARLRHFLFIQRVLRDDRTHGEEILAQN